MQLCNHIRADMGQCMGQGSIGLPILYRSHGIMGYCLWPIQLIIKSVTAKKSCQFLRPRDFTIRRRWILKPKTTLIGHTWVSGSINGHIWVMGQNRWPINCQLWILLILVVVDHRSLHASITSTTFPKKLLLLSHYSGHDFYTMCFFVGAFAAD